MGERRSGIEHEYVEEVKQLANKFVSHMVGCESYGGV